MGAQVNQNEQALIEAVADMREQEALALARELLDGGTDPLVVLERCRQAMDIVGKRFESGEYFLPELMLAGEMLEEIGSIVKPLIEEREEGPQQTLGRVLIGTVQGDLHDIGKNIVTFMLDINGFEVRDLGVDVPPDVFVAEVQEFQPQVLGLSGFLTLAFDSMKQTVEAIEQQGLRTDLKVLIGGGQVDQTVCNYTGADGWGANAVEAVSMCQEWTQGAVAS
jgi:methanogenic corrinoid protein MtbC1